MKHISRLDRIREIAREDATRIGRPLAILNLNSFNPLYVIREVPKNANPHLVEIVQPEHTS